MVITYPIPPKPTSAIRVCVKTDENLASSSAMRSCRPTKSGSLLNGTVEAGLIMVCLCAIFEDQHLTNAILRGERLNLLHIQFSYLQNLAATTAGAFFSNSEI